MNKLPELPREEIDDEDDEMVFEDNEVEMELPPPIEQKKARRKTEDIFVMPEQQQQQQTQPQPVIQQQHPPPPKPKKQISQKQQEHLERIRLKSMETRVTRSKAKKLEEAKKTLNVPQPQPQPQPQPTPYIQPPHQPQFIMMPNQQSSGLNRDDIESIVRSTMTNTLNDFKTKRDQELELKRARDEAERKESRERELTNTLLKPSYSRNKRYY